MIIPKESGPKARLSWQMINVKGKYYINVALGKYENIRDKENTKISYAPRSLNGPSEIHYRNISLDVMVQTFLQPKLE